MTRGIYAKYHYKSCYYLYKFVFVFPHLGAVGWEPHDGALESK